MFPSGGADIVFVASGAAPSPGALSFEPSVSRPGDAVTLEARLDLIIAFSACPQDILPINGRECVVRDAHFCIEG